MKNCPVALVHFTLIPGIVCAPLPTPALSGFQNKRNSSKGNTLFPIWALSRFRVLTLTLDITEGGDAAEGGEVADVGDVAEGGDVDVGGDAAEGDDVAEGCDDAQGDDVADVVTFLRMVTLLWVVKLL